MAAYRMPGPVGMNTTTDMVDDSQVKHGFPPGPIGLDPPRRLDPFVHSINEVDRIERLERELDCSPSDIDLAKRNGMVAWDVVALRDYCTSKKVLLVIRSANPKSREYRYRKGFSAKPSEASGESLKIKTGSKGVLLRKDVEENPDFGGNWKHAYHAQSEGFYSDYDIMCAWRRSGSRYERYELIQKSEIGDFDYPGPLLEDLNEACGWMFKHGANDHWLNENGRRRNQPKISDRYVAFDPDGHVHEFQNPIALSTFYRQLRLQVPYIG